MYKKENNSWLKHIDFVILDILCLQLAFILAYEIRVAKGIPYLNPLYENMAFVLVIFQLLVSFFGESFSGVPAKRLSNRNEMYDRTRNLRHASGCALSVYEPAGSDVFQRGIYDYVYAVLFYSVCSPYRMEESDSFQEICRR